MNENETKDDDVYGGPGTLEIGNDLKLGQVIIQINLPPCEGGPSACSLGFSPDEALQLAQKLVKWSIATRIKEDPDKINVQFGLNVVRGACVHMGEAPTSSH